MKSVPRFFIFGRLFAVLLAAGMAGSASAQAIGRTDPNKGPFPDSSIVNFQFLLDAPAGKHGFLTVDSAGHFAWPNGKRAKFWGVNISNRSVFISKDTIDTVVDTLARSGCNMVRFEALDSIGGLLDIDGSDSSRKIDKKKLDILDYWVWKLRERGIYYYLNLLDFRQFKPGDRIPAYDKIGRAAKPYAFFDARLIELQKEFAKQLLQHESPYTTLKYVDDPGLALMEVCNEHGLFFKTANLDTLAEPYGSDLRKQWNLWLKQHYENRENLGVSWNAFGAPGLMDSEDPANNSVQLPLFTPAGAPNVSAPNATMPDNPQGAPDPRRAPNRLRDGVRFLYDVQRSFFREMKSYLREIGLKIPVTGVVSNDMIPDVASAGAEMDFTSENYYADHPAFAGKDWEGTFFYSDSNPLRNSSTYQIAPWLAGLRWENKPVVVREWATVWPNRYRAVAIPEMAAYASMQDFDAVLLFGYQIAKDPETLSDFDHQADPPVWGLFAMGALTYLRGDVRPSPYSATILYTPDTLFKWPNILGNIQRLSWFVRLNSSVEQNPMVASSMVLASRSIPTLFDNSRGSLAGRGSTPRLAKSPIGLTVSADDGDKLPLLLDQYGQAGAQVNGSMLGTGVLVDSLHQIVRRTLEGTLAVTTPRTTAYCGELPVGKWAEAGPWSLITPTGVGALMAVSLDGRPLAHSTKYLVKMVSRAENTDQQTDFAPQGAPGKLLIKKWGKPPIITFGRSCDVPMRLKRNGQDLLSLAMIDGTWELKVDGKSATLVCDTPGIHGTLFGKQVVTTDAPTVVPALAPPPAKPVYRPVIYRRPAPKARRIVHRPVRSARRHRRRQADD